VVNAVDDRLRTAQQLRDTWTIEAIRPLGGLLQAAREAGRIVILTSDHGHVWHRDGSSTAFPDAGERWRPASDTPGPGEVLVQGSRVRGLHEQTRIIVPWQEHIRYVAAKNGYQGRVMTPAALAQDLDIPVVHLDNLLARLQRLLNIDGYTVLQVDRERNLVTLYMPLLQRQFALD
jgi:hypothetical protein